MNAATRYFVLTVPPHHSNPSSDPAKLSTCSITVPRPTAAHRQRVELPRLGELVARVPDRHVTEHPGAVVIVVPAEGMLPVQPRAGHPFIQVILRRRRVPVVVAGRVDPRPAHHHDPAPLTGQGRRNVVGIAHIVPFHREDDRATPPCLPRSAARRASPTRPTPGSGCLPGPPAPSRWCRPGSPPRARSAIPRCSAHTPPCSADTCSSHTTSRPSPARCLQ